MNIIIDNIDFWDGFEAQKYWMIPKSHSNKQKNIEIKNCMLSGNYIGSQKRDGIWAMIIKDDNGFFHLRSRTKNVEGTFADKSEWIPHIITELNDIPNGTVLIGELYKKGDEGSRKATAILNCLKEKSLERQKITPLTFYCFDILAYKGKALLEIPLEKRINHYLSYELLDVLQGKFIEIAEYFEGKELWNKCGELLKEGYEGMVIQRKSAKYLCGKRKAWESIKIKKEIEQTIDVFLDGAYKEPTMNYNGKEIETWPYWVNEKTGERSDKNKYPEYIHGETWTPVTKPYYFGWASAVSISVMREGKPFHLAWISGITDEMKKDIISNPEKYKNKVYEITCMEVEKIDGKYSLRHGKIVAPRPDKSAEDCDFSQIA